MLTPDIAFSKVLVGFLKLEIGFVKVLVGFLKLDGRPLRHKAIYLNFKLDKEAMVAVRAYPGVRMVVALYKRDCYDAMSDGGLAGGQGITSTWKPGCIKSGFFPVSIVRCPVSSDNQQFPKLCWSICLS